MQSVKAKRRRIGEAQSHGPSSSSSSGVIQPPAVSNTIHPQLNATLVHEKTSYRRMWAQLHKDQGSPQEKLTLEAEYDALQPKQRQQWRRQVCEFINNNSDVNGTTTRDSQWNRRRSTVDAPSTKALIAEAPSMHRRRKYVDEALVDEVLELGRMPRHSRGKPREVRLRQSLMVKA